jgi:two-component sensor histidine kinase
LLVSVRLGNELARLDEQLGNAIRNAAPGRVDHGKAGTRLSHGPTDRQPTLRLLAEGISAGLSLYEEHPAPGIFRWHHLQGTLAQFAGATTPHNNSPCGVVLDLNTPVLTAHSERGYDWLAEHNVSLPEVLLVPLHIGSKEPTGTLWIVSDEDGHFHKEHVRMTTELASFVAIALRMLSAEQRLQHALDEQLILSREMTHRIKNLFAMTDSMIRLTAKSSTTSTEMSEVLSGRLHALANAHSLVRPEFSELGKVTPASDLKDLIRKIVFPHEHLKSKSGSRFLIDGPPIQCGERATNGLALIFHELATNAAKYGALSIDDGSTSITWEVAEETLELQWREENGPAITPPSKKGFGSALVRNSILSLGGTLNYDWLPRGLNVDIRAPIERLSR